ncbi:LOW QUALITY PROTEIN: ATP-binding cassette sub-family G member 1 [Nilaparvata lugens]|uniref:LOW QUALITY PROTEIN: ATP-binding cassette sub-family G member 1 n=1 Tax=Nilaparvata lugens TaxID=108931 RepID=UPI00193DBDFA|nr:LOW QUALITY PROTEIN: ATP-binding cassette sub-family G member 1 [Nilaparvata lugens]
MDYPPAVANINHLIQRPPVDIEFTDLTYTVPHGRSGSKIILRSVSGLFKSGQLTAILGPSGAGKSTLLNVLAGYKCADSTGSILVNGRPRALQQFRKLSRYIMQEDMLQPRLTVQESMLFAVDLKLGTTISREEKLDTIDEILNMLRLSKTKNTLSGHLSGGEKKRLSIALELVNNPPVIFLDEPTTSVVEVSSGEYGDYLERMTNAIENGRCYKWNQNKVTDVRYQANEEEENLVSTDLHHMYNFESSAWLQFRILISRMSLQGRRDMGYIILKLAMHIFIGMIIGGMFFQIGNDGSKTIFNFGFCFVTIIIFLYIPMMPALLWFPQEVQLLKREFFNRWYDLNPYFFAMTFCQLPLQIVFGIGYALLTYFMTDQPMEYERVLKFILVCLMISIVSEAMGLAISARLNIVNGIFVGPAVSVPLMLLAVYGLGTGSKYIPSHIRFAMYFSYLRYGLEGLISSIYGGGRTKMVCPDSEIYCQLREPKALLKEVGMEDVNYWLDIAALAVSFLVFKVICYVLLRRRLKSTQSFGALGFIGRFIKTHFNLAGNIGR